MIQVGDRVYLKKDPVIEGYKIGDTGEVKFIESHEFFFPVQVQMDFPDINGHSYYRFNYDQLGVVKVIDWLKVPEPDEIDIPL